MCLARARPPLRSQVSAAALLLCGCSQAVRVPLKAAPALVEATGEVAAQRTETGHLQLAIEVARLAPAAMLAPDTVLYVVWAAPVGGGAVQNLGTLQVRDDRTGRMRATALFAESLRVEITPERAADLSSPTHDPVLWTALPGD